VSQKYYSHEGLLYETGFGNSHSYRQKPPRLRCKRPPAGKGETVGEKFSVNLPSNSQFHGIWRDLLHAANETEGLYFPSEGRHAEDFFALKNPTASAGLEPANLGTRGQHANP
jgi:hypothetical protein